MIDLLAKDADVPITDANGKTTIVPSFPKLRALVTSLTDSLTGAVAQARDINSQSLAFSVDSKRSADAAAVSASAAKVSETNLAQAVSDAAASIATSAASASKAAASEAAASTSASAASSSKVAAKASEDASKANMDNAGFSAAAAQTYRDDARLARDMSSSYANAPANVEVSPGKYSAFHWAEQARLTAVGAVIYKGSWDASGGTMPASPKLGDFYFISKAGTVGGVKFASGDMAVFDGTLWERIDNQQAVTTVAGRTGAVVLSTSDIGGLQAALDGKAPATNPTFTGSVLVRAAASMAVADFQSGNGYRLLVRDYGSLGVTVDAVNNANTAYAPLAFTGSTVTINNQTAWHAGNFNPSAKFDKVGGTVDGDVTINGILTTNLQITANGGVYATDPVKTGNIANGGTGGNRGLTAHANNNGGSTAVSAAVMTFIRDGFCGGYFGLDTDNKLKLGGWSFGNVAYKVLHEGENTYSFTGGLQLRAGALYGKLGAAFNPGAFSAGNADGCDNLSNNMAVYSWYGVGFGPSISGQGVPLGEFSHWFNTRSGDFGLRGSVNAWSSINSGGGMNVGSGFISTSAVHAVLGNNGSAGTVYLRPNGAQNGTGQFYVSANGDTMASGWQYAPNFKINSDARLKHDAVPLDPREELEKIKRLIPRVYVKDGHVEFGFFAQEMRDHFPTMVSCGDGPAGPDTLTLSVAELLAPLVAAVQLLDKRLTDGGL